MAKILAVEDEALLRILIVEMLTDAGHTLLEAADGEAGLAIVKATEDLDLIISDVRMSKMDGLALAQAARALRPDLAIILMTGYMGAELPSGNLAARVIQKPFDPDRLLSIVDQILSGRTLR